MRTILIRLIRLYQRLTEHRPSPCRHVPSCSTYASEAIQLHGAFKGMLLGTKRVLKCNPWGTQGFDPVPEPLRSTNV